MIKTAINLLSVIPMRKEPAHRSEMVSQLLFGEYAELLEEEKDFVKIISVYDGYEGWVQANQLTVVEEEIPAGSYIGSRVGEVLVNGISNYVSICSPVFTPQAGLVRFGANEIAYLPSTGEQYWKPAEKVFTQERLEYLYRKFLNTPYLWGGKSVFGIDCSGFAQQVFKMFGVGLLRDAYMQAEQGAPVSDIEAAKIGDLAFFSNDKGRIVHVGIILENSKIVHASGRVRIDVLDKDGIVNSETGKRTHQLHSMRRYF